jgi:hypothetical protein
MNTEHHPPAEQHLQAPATPPKSQQQPPEQQPHPQEMSTKSTPPIEMTPEKPNRSAHRQPQQQQQQQHGYQQHDVGHSSQPQYIMPQVPLHYRNAGRNAPPRLSDEAFAALTEERLGKQQGDV